MLHIFFSKPQCSNKTGTSNPHIISHLWETIKVWIWILLTNYGDPGAKVQTNAERHKLARNGSRKKMKGNVGWQAWCTSTSLIVVHSCTSVEATTLRMNE